MRNKAALIPGKRGMARPGRFCNGPLQNWLSDARSPFERSQSGAIMGPYLIPWISRLYPQARHAFDSLRTTDFEIVIHALRQAVTLLPLYGGGDDAKNLMERHGEALKELLVQAIAGKHPERPGDVSEEQYRVCRQFLAHFAGDGRNLKGSGGSGSAGKSVQPQL